MKPMITLAMGGALALGLTAFAPTAAAQDDGPEAAGGDTAAAVARLEGELTPMGAIRAGNEDGTIPPWEGGVTEPPAGYTPGDHHPAPFPEEEPRFVITADNMAQYADRLTDGHKALFERYPDSFEMRVFPTRRTASYPEKVYEAAKANETRAELINEGNGVAAAKIAPPFPTPENGLQAIWNHILRYRGDSMTRRVGQANPTAGGAYTMIMFEDDFEFPYAQHDYDPAEQNIIIYFIQRVVAPARRAGAILLVHETLNQVREPRRAWTYNPGQRRVRRAPNVAYDNPGTAADGLRTSDDFDMFNGAPERYDWELKGRREMIVPYNAYALHSDDLDYDDIIQAGHVNPEFTRYERHRVWVVEATLKEGTSHIYHRRKFYIDEDSWQILTFESYDDANRLWRVGEAHGINYYEVPTYWSTLDTIYDLQSGRYTALGFDNEERMYGFGVEFGSGNFTPASLRRQGRR